MRSAHCARCWRDRAESEYELDVPLPGAPYRAWRSLQGEDVCPDCQSEEERREGQRRVAEAIEREMERRRVAEIAPDPFEPPLIGPARSPMSPTTTAGRVARRPSSTPSR